MTRTTWRGIMLGTAGVLFGLLCGTVLGRVPVPISTLLSASRAPGVWAGDSVSIHWQAEPAERALQALADSLGVPLWLPEEAREELQARRVTLDADHLTQEQAIRWLARLCHLRAVRFDPGVYLLEKRAGSEAWGMVCRGQAGPSDLSSGIPSRASAALDIRDATAVAAAKAIGRAFGVNVACELSVSSCQQLVTLQSPDESMPSAMESWCDQTGMAVRWLDGVYVFGAGPALPAAPTAAGATGLTECRTTELSAGLAGKRPGTMAANELCRPDDVAAAMRLMEAAGMSPRAGATGSPADVIND